MSSILGEYGSQIIKELKGIIRSQKEEKPKQQYADCIIRNDKGEFLLLQRATDDDFQPGKWCLPGGKIEPGEAPNIAAARELQEETGIEIDVDPITTVDKDTCTIHYHEGFSNSVEILDNDEHYQYTFVPETDLNKYDLILDLGEVLNQLIPKLSPIPMNINHFSNIEEEIAMTPAPDVVLDPTEITKAFDAGQINEDDWLTYEQRKDAFNLIKKGYDQGMITDEQFFGILEKAKHHEFVQVTRDGKTFYQYREVGTDKVEEDIAEGDTVDTKDLGLTIKKYSDKSFLITGDTLKNLDLLRKIKAEVGFGVWNKGLNGWIFPLSGKEKMLSLLAEKMPVDTYDEQVAKDAVIALKNAVDAGTEVNFDDLYGFDDLYSFVDEVTTNEEGKVEYTVVTEPKKEEETEPEEKQEDPTPEEKEPEPTPEPEKKTVTEEEIGIPPADEKKAEELINNANEENRFKVAKQLFGKDPGEKPVSDAIEKEGEKDLKILKMPFRARSGKKFEALDYTNVNHEDIVLYDVDNILKKPKPYYIPDINEYQFSGYGDKNFVFDAVKLEDGKYIVNLNGDEGKKKLDSYYGNKNKRDIDAAEGLAVMSLDVFVATTEYYRAKRKAELKVEAEETNNRMAEKWSKFDDAKKDSWMAYGYAKFDLTREEWAKLSTKEKEDYYIQKKIKPYKVEKAGRISIMADNRMSFGQMHMYQEYVDNFYRRGARGLSAKDPDYTEYLEMKNLVRQKAVDMELQKEEFDSSYTKGKETSYGDSNTKDHLLESHGVKIKTQNGTELKPSQIEEIKTHLTDVYNVFGDKSSMSKNFGLKISHSGEKMMHARKAMGLYHPAMRAIGVSAFGGEFGLTLAHEFAHFMDNYLGKTNSKRHFASDDYNSTAGMIASTFRNNMNKKQESKYMNRTCECFARALEQYHAWKTTGDESYYFKHGHHVNLENFKTKVAPLIEQFLKDNDHLLKSAYDDLTILGEDKAAASFDLIKSAFSAGQIDEPTFLEYQQKYELSKADPSHGGKLVKKTILNKMGKKETVWVKRDQLDESDDKGQNKPKEPVPHSTSVLAAYAKEAPAAELKRSINEHHDPAVRKAAHDELARREKHEKPQDKEDKKAPVKKKDKVEPKKESKPGKEEKEQKERKYVAYRYGKPGGEDGIEFSSRDIDYAEEYATVKGGKKEDVKEVNFTAKNPLEVNLSPKEFSDPKAEKKHIEQAMKDGNDLVIFRDTENDFEFYVKIPKQVDAKKESAKLPEKKEEVQMKPKSLKQLESKNKSTLPKVPTKNIFLNDVSLPPREEVAKADEYLEDDKEKDLPVRQIKISDIIPTQKNVTIGNLKSASGSKDNPVLLKLDGKYYVLDGHHRISNAILAGEDSIDAHIFSKK